MDDWEFREEPFLEFVGPCLQTLAEQLQSCSDYDAQLKVMGSPAQVPSCAPMSSPIHGLLPLIHLLVSMSKRCCKPCRRGLTSSQRPQPSSRQGFSSGHACLPCNLAQLQAGMAWQTCMALLNSACFVQIFHVLAAIIERLGSDVQPYTAGFLSLLPAVWQQAEGMPLVRLQVGFKSRWTDVQYRQAVDRVSCACSQGCMDLRSCAAKAHALTRSFTRILMLGP